MADRMRTEFKGNGGRITLTIHATAACNFELCVTEDACRLTRIDRATITAAELDAAENPDKLIHDTAVRLIGNYITYNARSMEGQTYEFGSE